MRNQGMNNNNQKLSASMLKYVWYHAINYCWYFVMESNRILELQG